MKSLRQVLNLSNLLVSISAIGTLIWFHGYQYEVHHLIPHLSYLKFCFGYYIFQYAIRAKFSKNTLEYIRNSTVEFFLLTTVIVELLLNGVAGYSMIQPLMAFTGIENHDHLFILSLHVWLLVIVGIELGKASLQSTIWKLPPSLLFLLSFAVLTTIGSALLMLPEMTMNNEGMSFIDAFFTSVSANCVTGLKVVDTASYFSFKGKLLILTLIQLGGLNIIAFATFFISLFHKTHLSKSHRRAAREFLRAEDRKSVIKMLRRIIITTVIIEGVGAIILFNCFGAAIIEPGKRLFYAVFHSVSAFNNAGFSLFTDGLMNPDIIDMTSFQIVIASLIIMGGIGFTTLRDIARIWHPGRWFNERLTKFTLQSRISVYSSFVLICLGAVLFFGAEYDGVLNGLTSSEIFTTSMFQSITARTAGFNTVEINSLGSASLILLMILMFIGASSGSTGGGIKTSTLYVLIQQMFNKTNLPSDRFVPMFPKRLAKKAFEIFIYSLLSILLFAVILTSTESFPAVDLLFEVVSAVGTVGLSTGLTPDLSTSGKYVIILCMFIGRVGPLIIANTLLRKNQDDELAIKSGMVVG